MGEHWGTSETDQPINLERMELEQNWKSTARDAAADLEKMKDFGGIFTRLQPTDGPRYYYTYDLIDWPRVPKIAQMH